MNSASDAAFRRMECKHWRQAEGSLGEQSRSRAGRERVARKSERLAPRVVRLYSLRGLRQISNVAIHALEGDQEVSEEIGLSLRLESAELLESANGATAQPPTTFVVLKTTLDDIRYNE
jgi:hypothetical protein